MMAHRVVVGERDRAARLDHGHQRQEFALPLLNLGGLQGLVRSRTISRLGVDRDVRQRSSVRIGDRCGDGGSAGGCGDRSQAQDRNKEHCDVVHRHR